MIVLALKSSFSFLTYFVVNKNKIKMSLDCAKGLLVNVSSVPTGYFSTQHIKHVHNHIYPVYQYPEYS